MQPDATDPPPPFERPPAPLRVECRRQGSRLIPVRFGPTGREHEVSEILDWWPGEGQSYVKLRTRGGGLFILRHHTARDLWDVGHLEAGGPGGT